MLSNNTFSETRIQWLLDGLFFVEKGLGVHVQRMLKISRFYTLAGILAKYLLKNEGKLGTLFTIITPVNVYVDLVVFTRIAGTS